MTLKRLLLLVAVVLFLAVGAGFDTIKFGTVTLALIGFGLACFAASELA